jgi:hypothetical protein
MQNGFNHGPADHGSVDLEACLVQVEASKAWFTRRVLPLSVEQLLWRPEVRRWSIAECLDHLNLTFRLWLPKLTAATAIGWRQGHTVDAWLRYDQSELDALKRVEPPVIARTAAPPALVPTAGVDPDQLVDHFFESRDRYAEAVRRAFGLDLPRILIAEPLAPLIHSLGGALAFLAAHDRRHMWQSERVRSAPHFPSAAFSDGGTRQIGLLTGEKDNTGG